MRNNNKILYISIAILVLAVGIALGTYAYYQTTITGTISGNVSKWEIISMGVEPVTGAISLGDLYPGKKASYGIGIQNSGELDAYFELYFTDDDAVGNLYFVQSEKSAGALDKFHTENWSLNDFNIENIQDCMHKGVYGSIPAGGFIPIYLLYNWDYSGLDTYDENADSTYKYQIITRQLTGYSGELPMRLFESEGFYVDYYEDIFDLGGGIPVPLGFIQEGGCAT